MSALDLKYQAMSHDYARRDLPSPDHVAAVDLVAVLAVGSEGTSRGVMEAMALGKLVVGARVGVIPDIIEEGRTGRLVEPNRADLLAGALRQALAEPATRALVGSAAAAAIRTRFRCERQAKETLDLYREILQREDRTLPAACSR